MKLLSVVLLTSSVLTFYANAKTDLALGLQSSLVYSENETLAAGSRSSNTLTIQPTLSITQSTRKTRTNANFQHMYINELSSVSDEDIGNNKSNFTNYNITTRINVIENALRINGRASQSYRNTSASNALVNDQIFGNQDLSKTENYSAGFDLTLNRFDYVELIADGNVSNVKSDRQTDFDNGLDTTNSDYSATILAGKEFRYIDWNFTANYADTNGSSRNDSVSESYIGNIYIGLVKRLRFVVTGTIEKNDITSTQVDGDRRIEYKTAGAGLSWFRDRSRFLDVTYNISSRSGDNAQRDKFVGVNFGWRFSARTNVTGNLGRRFFGRSANFSLNHNIRKFRTRIAYNEAVTNFSRLIASNQSIGGIVCPVGAVDFTQCFIPDTINYDLQPGEEFTSLNFIVPEISEQTILRKNFTFETNYRFRKLNLSFTANVADTEYLDGSREETRQNLTLAANLKLSRKLTVSWSNRFTKFENQSVATGTENTDDIWTSTFSSSYQNNKSLSTALSLRYSERESSVFERNYDGIRISLSTNYRF